MAITPVPVVVIVTVAIRAALSITTVVAGGRAVTSVEERQVKEMKSNQYGLLSIVKNTANKQLLFV